MRQGRTINWGLRHTFRSVERGTEGGQELRVWATDEGGRREWPRGPASPEPERDAGPRSAWEWRTWPSACVSGWSFGGGRISLATAPAFTDIKAFAINFKCGHSRVFGHCSCSLALTEARHLRHVLVSGASYPGQNATISPFDLFFFFKQKQTVLLEEKQIKNRKAKGLPSVTGWRSETSWTAFQGPFSKSNEFLCSASTHFSKNKNRTAFSQNETK